jgi:hypothetical protein
MLTTRTTEAVNTKCMYVVHLAGAYLMGSHTVYKPQFILKSRVKFLTDVSLTHIYIYIYIYINS